MPRWSGLFCARQRGKCLRRIVGNPILESGIHRNLRELTVNASDPGNIRDAAPAPVRRYFDYALPGTGEAIVRMEAVQRGAVRTAVDSQCWLSFTALHHVEPAAAAFAWDARVRMLGPLSLRVSDGFRDGQGYGKVGLGKHITLARAQGGADMN